jgi:hypothetical protein
MRQSGPAQEESHLGIDNFGHKGSRLGILLRSFDGITDRRVFPTDGATGEGDADVKATFCPGVAVHDMSQLRELTLGNNKCFFPWPPEAHGHQASAVRTDIPGNRPFLRTRGHRHCDLDQDNQGRAPFYSSVEVPLAKTKWWSTRIHGWLKSLPDSKPLPLETFLASPTNPLTFGYRGGNCGETSIPWQVIPLVRPGKASSWRGVA